MPPDSSYRHILKLAVPLMLSMAGFMLMQMVDAIFLSWYSPTAIAAIGPGGMASFCLQSLFSATAGYTATFVAQYLGARDPYKAHSALWQGIYFCCLSALLVFFTAYLIQNLFFSLGHSSELALMEKDYFRVTSQGAIFSLLINAFIGYFSGIGRTEWVMGVSFIGLALNGILDYVFIFGALSGGIPEGGIWGAAYATICAQAVEVLIYYSLYRRSCEASEAIGKGAYRFDRSLFIRFL